MAASRHFEKGSNSTCDHLADKHLGEYLCPRTQLIDSSEKCKRVYMQGPGVIEALFSTVVTKLWNDLPVSLRNCISVDIFKRILKRLYFDYYFSFF